MRRYEWVRLSDLWWWGKSRQHPEWQPQSYVCPLLMTLSIWLYRLRGQDAYWEGVKRLPGQPFPPLDEDGSYAACAKVLIGRGEAGCLFPRWMILTECHYRNFGFSRRFWREAVIGPFRLWSRRYGRR